MSTYGQTVKIKCPHCGWIRRINTRVVEDESLADVTRGVGEVIRDIARRVQAALASPVESTGWIDIPACPHCDNPYQYNVHTGEVRK